MSDYLDSDLLERLYHFEENCINPTKEQILVKRFENELKPLWERTCKEKLPENIKTLLEIYFFSYGSDALLPRHLPSIALKRIIQEEYWRIKHPHTKKVPILAVYIYLLYNAEAHIHTTRKFSAHLSDILEACNIYFIEASLEVLSREEKIEYRSSNSLKTLYSQGNQGAKFAKDKVFSLEFRCSTGDIETLQSFHNRVNEHFPHNFTEKEVFMVLVNLYISKLIYNREDCKKYLKKVSIQDPKLTKRKNYKSVHIYASFDSLYKGIEIFFPDKSYSKSEVFRSVIASIENVSEKIVADSIKEIRNMQTL